MNLALLVLAEFVYHFSQRLFSFNLTCDDRAYCSLTEFDIHQLSFKLGHLFSLLNFTSVCDEFLNQRPVRGFSASCITQSARIHLLLKFCEVVGLYLEILFDQLQLFLDFGLVGQLGSELDYLMFFLFDTFLVIINFLPYSPCKKSIGRISTAKIFICKLRFIASTACRSRSQLTVFNAQALNFGLQFLDLYFQVCFWHYKFIIVCFELLLLFSV